MSSSTPQLFYDASCGWCRREINKLRPRLEPQVELIDISAPGFQPPEGYTLNELLTRIHYYDGQKMKIGLAATLAYWHQAGLTKTSAVLGLPGLFHIGNLVYNLWAVWRRRHSSQCQISRQEK